MKPLLIARKGDITEAQYAQLVHQGYDVLCTIDPERVKVETHVPLRDQFAMAALTGMIASGAATAKDAYEWADAMLAAREKKPA